MTDPFDLQRFVDAQADIYDRALAECRAGRKRSHWMWFVFPQMRGLGSSAMAAHYGISSIEEAGTYLAHPILGPRLLDCVAALQDLNGVTDPVNVFGTIDAMKLRSSLTLFAAAGGGAILTAALDRWFDGRADPATMALIAAA